MLIPKIKAYISECVFISSLELRGNFDSEDRILFWIADSKHGSDGPSLVDIAQSLTTMTGKKLIYLIPHRVNFSELIRNIIFILKGVSIQDLYVRRVRSLLAKISDRPFLMDWALSSSKGRAARYLGDKIKGSRYEIQHGVISGSYFPLSCDFFCARGTYWADFVSKHQPKIAVLNISHDLDLLPRQCYVGKLGDFDLVTFHSKVPGLRNTPRQIAHLEWSLYLLARDSLSKFDLRLHPRDRVLYFVLRQGLWRAFILIAASLLARLMRVTSRPQNELAITCFSTVLFEISGPRANIDIENTDGITLEAYSIFPPNSIKSIAEAGEIRYVE